MRAACVWERRSRSVVTVAMPMLPPRLRIRLKIPVAFPSCSSRSVATVSVASGAKTSAVPKPLMTAGQITLLGATATLSPPSSALEYATVDDAHQAAGGEHGGDRPEAAGARHQARLEGGVPEERLQEQRQQRGHA